MSTNIIALDPGFGSTKVCCNGKTALLQTAVSRPKSVGLAAIGMRAAGRHVPIVSVDGRDFAIGPGSWARGDPLTSMDYSSIVTPERLALFYGVLAQAIAPTAPPSKNPIVLAREAVLVIGLPVPLLQDEVQARAVIDSLRHLKGQHTFSIGAQAYTFDVVRIKVAAQPVGAYVDWLYDDQLEVRANGKDEVAIIDIGLNTLDLYVVQGGQVMESFIGGAEVGVKRLLELLAVDGHDMVEMDAGLRSGTVKPDAVHLDAWLGEVLAAIKKTFPTLKRFGVVIPAGGGAQVLGERLRTALDAKGARLAWPEDPITTNVRGLWKFGMRHGG